MIPLSDDHGAVRVLTMNRPEVHNALSTELFEALYAALGDADADDSVRAVVLTGTDPAFCAACDFGAQTAARRTKARRNRSRDGQGQRGRAP
jgi:enoyl-CoA hydratase/carnithine racemase